VESTGQAHERVSSWTRRSVELGARIRELHERNAELSANPGPADLESNRAMGSTTSQVAKAEALARMANLRALEATRRTALMRLHAASAHDRAARLHELLADTGRTDVQEHRERAAAHRELAREDRTAAERIFRSHRAEPPEPGIAEPPSPGG
jgi:hypothetical protein